MTSLINLSNAMVCNPCLKIRVALTSIGWKNFFSCLWGGFQGRLTSIVEDLRKHAELVDKEANAYHIAESYKSRDESRAWRQRIQQEIDQKEKEQAHAQYQSVQSWLRTFDWERPEPSEIFDSASPGTCGWIVQNSRIAPWLRPGQETPFFWINGNPGSGKIIPLQSSTFVLKS